MGVGKDLNCKNSQCIPFQLQWLSIIVLTSIVLRRHLKWKMDEQLRNARAQPLVQVIIFSLNDNVWNPWNMLLLVLRCVVKWS